MRALKIIIVSYFIFFTWIQFASAIAVDKPKDDVATKNFSQATINAWTNAGALVGWLTITEFGSWQYLKDKPKGVDALPVFLWQKYIENVIVNLPKPAVSFALGFGNSGMTNTGLNELAGLQNLQALDLSHAKVTDDGLKKLAVLENLRSLDIGASSVTDAGLKNLLDTKSLQRLYIGATSVTDEGVSALVGLDDLRVLYLYKTLVTDEGIMRLAELKKLQRLLLTKTKVTDKGVAELMQLRPHLKILH